MSVIFSTTQTSANTLNTPYTGSAIQPITVMAWIFTSEVGTPATYRDIVTADPNLYMQLWSDGTSIDYGTQHNDHVGPSLLANTWYHTCEVVVPTSTTSRQIYGYLNGQLVVNVADTDTSVTYTAICVGNSIFSSYVYPFNGWIRDVRVWTRQLTATEIVDEMLNKRSVHKQGLYVESPLDDNNYADLSGNNNLFTNGSAVTIGSGNIHAFAKKRRSFP